MIPPVTPAAMPVPISAADTLLALAVIEVKAVVPPIAPEAIISPVPPVRERVCAPSMVPSKVRFPVPDRPELIEEFPISVIGDPIVKWAPLVAKLALSATPPLPD